MLGTTTKAQRLNPLAVCLGALFVALCLIPGRALASPPFRLPEMDQLRRITSAVISTTKGKILVELYPEEAPWHVANFKYLADRGFYRNLSFHLVMKDYVVQGGDPTGTGNGGPGWFLPPEFSEREQTMGTLGMARRPDEINPERLSNGSQFHILLADSPHMNRKYTVFGHVVSGMKVVNQIQQGDRIKDIAVYVRPL